MSQTETLAAVILAAGKGTRMKSPLPKVLHEVASKTMLDWVLDAVAATGAQSICLILGGELSAFDALLNARSRPFTVAIQKDRRGTADAVASAAESFKNVKRPPYFNGEHHSGPKIESDRILICTGDIPNIAASTLVEFVKHSRNEGSDLSVVGMVHPRPFGYGRLVLNSAGSLEKIVEEKDADAEVKKINLCNSGVILAKTQVLFELLAKVEPTNAQKEYYLTDIFSLAQNQGLKVGVYKTTRWQEFEGINDIDQLKQVEELILGRR